MQDKFLKVNPWTRIWTHPRETVRNIVEFNPKFRFILLSFIHGLPMLLYTAQDLSLGNTLTPAGIIIGAIIVATFIGMLSITIGSALFFWTGKWIGGKASYYPIRAAVSWSNVPNIVVILSWILLILYFGSQVFFVEFQSSQFTGAALVVNSIVLITQAVMSIWSLVLLIKGLAEVQGFSAWKGLLNVLIPFFMIAIFIWALGGIISFFMQ